MKEQRDAVTLPAAGSKFEFNATDRGKEIQIGSRKFTFLMRLVITWEKSKASTQKETKLANRVQYQ